MNNYNLRLKSILHNKTIIAGPCSAESEEQVMCTAEKLYEQGIRIFRAGVWKPRTRPGSFEGYGEEALIWMAAVKKKFPDMKLATEVAKPDHISLCIKYGIDIIWIGARTSASPFAMQDLADLFIKDPTLCNKFDCVYVKNPVNPDLDLWTGAIERLQLAGVKNLAAIHRGFCLYDNNVYRNTPTWQIPIDLKKRFPDMKLICDPSHMGGKRDLIAPLCKQAIALGFDGLMIECHCNPDKALTDAKQQIPPDSLDFILTRLQDDGDFMYSNVEVDETKSQDELYEDGIKFQSEQMAKAIDTRIMLRVFRDKIDKIDDDIIYKLADRLKICRMIAKVKKTAGLPIFQDERYKEVLNKFRIKAGSVGLDEELAENIFNAIHEESVREQTEISKT